MNDMHKWTKGSTNRRVLDYENCGCRVHTSFDWIAPSIKHLVPVFTNTTIWLSCDEYITHKLLNE